MLGLKVMNLWPNSINDVIMFVFFKAYDISLTRIKLQKKNSRTIKK